MLCIKVENSVSFPDTENAQKNIAIFPHAEPVTKKVDTCEIGNVSKYL